MNRTTHSVNCIDGTCLAFSGEILQNCRDNLLIHRSISAFTAWVVAGLLAFLRLQSLTGVESYDLVTKKVDDTTRKSFVQVRQYSTAI